MKKSEELEVQIDLLSEELRLLEKEITEFMNDIHIEWTMDEFYTKEANRDDMQEHLADMHIQLGMAYRLEMLDGECDTDHSLVLSTVYNC